jgi:hypothetical protein
MDRLRIIEQHLAAVETHVAQGEQHLAEQRQRIDVLKNGGHDPAVAEALLMVLEQSQALHRSERNRLKAELKSTDTDPFRTQD